MATPIAWTVNTKGEVWTLQPQGGGNIFAPAESALSIGTGADGTVWIVSMKPLENGTGNVIQYFSGSGWTSVPGEVGGVTVAGDPSGRAWIVDEGGTVWVLDKQGNSKQMSTEEFAIDIGVGTDGTVWIVSTQTREAAGGNIVMYLSPGSTEWVATPPPQAAVAISGSNSGVAWSVNTYGEIWTLDPQGGGNLMSPRGTATDVSVGPDGTAWMISTIDGQSGGGNEVMWYNTSSGQWEAVPYPASASVVAGSIA